MFSFLFQMEYNFGKHHGLRALAVHWNQEIFQDWVCHGFPSILLSCGCTRYSGKSLFLKWEEEWQWVRLSQRKIHVKCTLYTERLGNRASSVFLVDLRVLTLKRAFSWVDVHLAWWQYSNIWKIVVYAVDLLVLYLYFQFSVEGKKLKMLVPMKTNYLRKILCKKKRFKVWAISWYFQWKLKRLLPQSPPKREKGKIRKIKVLIPITLQMS